MIDVSLEPVAFYINNFPVIVRNKQEMVDKNTQIGWIC